MTRKTTTSASGEPMWTCQRFPVVSESAVEAIRFANIGLAKCENEQWESGIADFDKAIDLDPSCATAFVRRGWATYNANGQYAQAIEDFSSALRIDPTMVEAIIHRADVFWDQGDNEKAINDCDTALRLGKKRAAAYRVRAIAHIDQGSNSRAYIDAWFARILDFHGRLDPQRTCLIRLSETTLERGRNAPKERPPLWIWLFFAIWFGSGKIGFMFFVATLYLTAKVFDIEVTEERTLIVLGIAFPLFYLTNTVCALLGGGAESE